MAAEKRKIPDLIIGNIYKVKIRYYLDQVQYQKPPLEFPPRGGWSVKE
jgi:hypothetical protein